jgi:hypothetical protein
VPTQKKEEVITAIHKRVRDGKPVGIVRYKGKEIDKKRIRRFIDADEAKSEKVLRFGKNM